MDLTFGADRYPGMLISRCKSCGTTMGYPTQRVKLCYRNCTYCNMNCHNDEEAPNEKADHRQHGERIRTGKKKGMMRSAKTGDIHIRGAAWGHMKDPSKALDVTEKLESLFFFDPERGHVLRLPRREFNPIAAFGDPCPGARKKLSIRAVWKGRRWEILVAQAKGRRKLREDVILQPPRDPWLYILHATFGHPSDPRLQYDVTEKLQGRIDQHDGRYLGIPKDENICRWVGNPSPKGRKELTVTYEMHGWQGEVALPEAHGHLLEPLTVVAPMVCPQLKITHARYGVLAPLREQSMLPGARPKFVEKFSRDVSVDLQDVVDYAEGDRLILSCEEDINEVFGEDPCPGVVKTLHFEYESRDHAGNLKLKVDPHGRLQRDIELVTLLYSQGDRGATKMRHNDQLVSPGVELRAAAFGHPEDTQKCIDVTRQLQIRLDQNKGRNLHIGRGEDLYQLFGDPCRGIFKVLKIRYHMPGWTQTLRVESDLKNDKGLRCALRIGWPSRPLVSPIPQDVPIKKYSFQGWSTRWNGEFDEAAKAEADHAMGIRRHWRAVEHKAMDWKKKYKGLSGF
eukprot:g1896.t1